MLHRHSLPTPELDAVHVPRHVLADVVLLLDGIDDLLLVEGHDPEIPQVLRGVPRPLAVTGELVV